MRLRPRRARPLRGAREPRGASARSRRRLHAVKLTEAGEKRWRRVANRRRHGGKRTHSRSNWAQHSRKLPDGRQRALPARRNATRRCGASRQRCAKSSRTHDEIWRLSATAAPLPMQARLSYSARLLLMRPRCGGSSPWRFMKQKRARHRRRRLWLGQRGRMRRVQKL